MEYVVLLFGVAMLVSGMIIVAAPEKVFDPLRKHINAPGLQVAAVGVRVFIGAALITVAAESNYPTATSVLGWISILAALVLGVMGRSNFIRLMNWALGLSFSHGRIGGAIAIMIGEFLILAVA